MSVSKYYELELNQLLCEFNKISLFTEHPATIGTYREQVLKNYLKKFLPKNITISSGFIFDHNNAEQNQLFSQQTKQIDCLIYDNNNYTPFLKTENFVIIDPNSLFAGIEIKSSLTFHKEYDHHNRSISSKYPFINHDNTPYRWAGTLIDALINIQSLYKIAFQYNKKYFNAIFAYSSNFDFHNLFLAFDNEEIQRQLGISHLYELPNYICIPNERLVYFGRTSIFVDESKGFDPYESEMTVIENDTDNPAFTLQFFSNALKIQLDYNLFGKKPDKRGLFTSGLGKIGFWNNHFPLNSE
jgi:hypothetical protein